uniref:Uncharacterized protein n=1 Tax=Chromera velia CCMP2878 TaxID=1169474 RepID=A0A0G4HSP2_9ALVE|eukprot:Cvel_8332.t1-p1 / transcript=Cvel_8332.t1 / gene=Cvel_8332 / organism=Chromera_velia_CCMP2878 / gene_product=hypothetical protein / transcript_product=hypothetical protein / location=Cvel_scaffold458:52720-56488(+) / protein_length=874 / sequence_SO=supercontig / SO=protein_coding / is_pseudo=false
MQKESSDLCKSTMFGVAAGTNALKWEPDVFPNPNQDPDKRIHLYLHSFFHVSHKGFRTVVLECGFALFPLPAQQELKQRADALKEKWIELARLHRASPFAAEEDHARKLARSKDFRIRQKFRTYCVELQHCIELYEDLWDQFVAEFPIERLSLPFWWEGELGGKADIGTDTWFVTWIVDPCVSLLADSPEALKLKVLEVLGPCSAVLAQLSALPARDRLSMLERADAHHIIGEYSDLHRYLFPLIKKLRSLRRWGGKIPRARHRGGLSRNDNIPEGVRLACWDWAFEFHEFFARVISARHCTKKIRYELGRLTTCPSGRLTRCPSTCSSSVSVADSVNSADADEDASVDDPFREWEILDDTDPEETNFPGDSEPREGAMEVTARAQPEGVDSETLPSLFCPKEDVRSTPISQKPAVVHPVTLTPCLSVEESPLQPRENATERQPIFTFEGFRDRVRRRHFSNPTDGIEQLMAAAAGERLQPPFPVHSKNSTTDRISELPPTQQQQDKDKERPSLTPSFSTATHLESDGIPTEATWTFVSLPSEPCEKEEGSEPQENEEEKEEKINALEHLGGPFVPLPPTIPTRRRTFKPGKIELFALQLDARVSDEHRGSLKFPPLRAAGLRQQSATALSKEESSPPEDTPSLNPLGNSQSSPSSLRPHSPSVQPSCASSSTENGDVQERDRKPQSPTCSFHDFESEQQQQQSPPQDCRGERTHAIEAEGCPRALAAPGFWEDCHEKVRAFFSSLGGENVPQPAAQKPPLKPQRDRHEDPTHPQFASQGDLHQRQPAKQKVPPHPQVSRQNRRLRSKPARQEAPTNREPSHHSARSTSDSARTSSAVEGEGDPWALAWQSFCQDCQATVSPFLLSWGAQWTGR